MIWHDQIIRVWILILYTWVSYFKTSHYVFNIYPLVTPCSKTAGPQLTPSHFCRKNKKKGGGETSLPLLEIKIKKKRREKPTHWHHISSGNFQPWPLRWIKRWPHKWINLTLPVPAQDVDAAVLMSESFEWNLTRPNNLPGHTSRK